MRQSRAHDDDDSAASDYPLATEDQLRARALEELLKGVRPAARRAISRRFSKLSSRQLYDLENALIETAKAECLRCAIRSIARFSWTQAMGPTTTTATNAIPGPQPMAKSTGEHSTAWSLA